MEPQQLSFLLLLLFLIIPPMIYFLTTNKRHPSPPSPRSLPIIGHLHLLSLPLHRSLSRLSSLHDSSPLLLLRLGSRLALLVSSFSAAEQCFTKHDLTFANRPSLPSSKRLSYNLTTLVAAPYGPHWRNLRRIASSELFSSSRLNSFSHVVGEEVARMIKGLAINGGSGFRKVEVRERADDLALNVVMRMMVGRRCEGEERRRVRWVVKEGFELAKENGLGDFLPFLGMVGRAGRERRMVRLEKEADELFGNIVEEIRRRRMEEAGGESGIVARLLELQEKDRHYYTDEIIKGVISTMIAAGTDTTAKTLEWAMSLLLNHPQSLQKAMSEIELLVGHDRLIQESDLCNLPYLQSILKETLRLYPVAPLLLPHESSEGCTVAGFHVPRGTILFVNAYHIQRDPKVWEDPHCFKPERFMKAAAGSGLKMMMPFGMGRRSCPGEGLAMRLMGLTLGAMVQCLEWRRVGEEEVDMEEGAGMTMPMAKPLEALCVPRGIIV